MAMKASNKRKQAAPSTLVTGENVDPSDLMLDWLSENEAVVIQKVASTELAVAVNFLITKRYS